MHLLTDNTFCLTSDLYILGLVLKMATSNKKFSSMFHAIVIRMMQKHNLNITGSQSFKYVDSLIDVNRLVHLGIVITQTLAIKKTLDVTLKAQNGRHITYLV